MSPPRLLAPSSLLRPWIVVLPSHHRGLLSSPDITIASVLLAISRMFTFVFLIAFSVESAEEDNLAERCYSTIQGGRGGSPRATRRERLSQ
mmetsp:Transcript_27571/g.110459  ORF Transcript_27571/g.110459 Transcript_27571/m.110459 type:complete len:91 (-) Transcript_27571:60-332(-)